MLDYIEFNKRNVDAGGDQRRLGLHLHGDGIIRTKVLPRPLDNDDANAVDILCGHRMPGMADN